MARKTSKTQIADPPNASSSSEQEDEDDKEEESLTQSPKTHEISAKAIKEPSKTKKTGSKRSNMSDQEPKESKRSKKEPGEEGSGSAAEDVLEVEDVKKKKKKTGEEDEKKQLFQRLFSEDDETVVLKGLLDYLTQKKVDYPSLNTNAFYDFVKDSIHTDVSKQQLVYKVRRLKKKFENNARRSKQGEDRIFTNPHEQIIFELSKKIWGKQGISWKLGNGNVEEEDCGEEIEAEMELSKTTLGTSLFDIKSGVGSLENEILKHGFDVVEGEKKESLEEKWRKLQVAELELFVERNELIIEQAKLMLEVYKSEDA